VRHAGLEVAPQEKDLAKFFKIFSGNFPFYSGLPHQNLRMLAVPLIAKKMVLPNILM
jgi:hypothetical protein